MVRLQSLREPAHFLQVLGQIFSDELRQLPISRGLVILGGELRIDCGDLAETVRHVSVPGLNSQHLRSQCGSWSLSLLYGEWRVARGQTTLVLNGEPSDGINIGDVLVGARIDTLEMTDYGALSIQLDKGIGIFCDSTSCENLDHLDFSWSLARRGRWTIGFTVGGEYVFEKYC